MCGIVVSCRTGAGLSLEEVGPAVARLAHRGPDGQTVWRSPGGHCVMGFRRLALVGPAHETQPFHAGHTTAVVNGEIYGYQRLRRALAERGAAFATASDCEVLVHGFRQADTEFFKQINGEFALVIWDEQRRRLVAARDRWGVKPLFYRQTADGIQIASEVKALAALGPSLRWDRDSLFQHFFASLGPTQTLYAGVRQVPPGHLLEWVEGEPIVRPYAEPLGSLRAEFDAAPPPQRMVELRQSLSGAVRDRFQGGVPVGFYLSGGVDSSAMLGCAVEQVAPGSLTAFTVDFGPGDADARQAASIAAALGVRHECLHVSAAQMADSFAAASYHAEIVGFNAIGAVRWILGREAARNGFRAIMAGDGADELFGGYGFTVMERLVQLTSGRGQEQVRQSLERARLQFAGELGCDLPLFSLGPRTGMGFLLDSWNHQRCAIRQLLAPSFKQTIADANPFEMLLSSIGMVEGEGLRYSMDVWLRSLFVNQILVSERLDMAHGVETRYPYLDTRVAEIAAGLPDAWLVDQTREKHFLRQTVASWLPAAAARTTKKPFEAPRSLLRSEGPFRDYLLDQFHSQVAHNSSILDQGKMIALAEGMPALSRDAGEKVDAMLMMALSLLEVQQGLCVAD